MCDPLFSAFKRFRELCTFAEFARIKTVIEDETKRARARPNESLTPRRRKARDTPQPKRPGRVDARRPAPALDSLVIAPTLPCPRHRPVTRPPPAPLPVQVGKPVRLFPPRPPLYDRVSMSCGTYVLRWFIYARASGRESGGCRRRSCPHCRSHRHSTRRRSSPPSQRRPP